MQEIKDDTQAVFNYIYATARRPFRTDGDKRYADRIKHYGHTSHYKENLHGIPNLIAFTHPLPADGLTSSHTENHDKATQNHAEHIVQIGSINSQLFHLFKLTEFLVNL